MFHESEVINFEKIYKAYLDCRKNKRNTINAIKFEFELENNLFFLLKDLIDKRYSPKRSICFVVTYPKPREIFAADFRDRVVHHLLIREIEYIWERRFIYDSCSCRKNKGTYFCIKRLESFMRKVTKNCTKKAYYA